MENDDTIHTPYSIDAKILSSQDFYVFVKKIILLPQVLKDALFEYSTSEFIEEKLGPQFQLDRNQKNEVLRIIRDIILSETYLGSLLTVLEQKLKVDKTKSREIANLILGGLFSQETIEEIKKVQISKFGQISRPPAQLTTPSQTTKTEIQNNPNTINLRNKQ